MNLTYVDGVIEGRLIERGFVAVSGGAFANSVHSANKMVVVSKGKGYHDFVLQLFDFIMVAGKEYDLALTVGEMVREQTPLLEVFGSVEDLIAVFKLLEVVNYEIR